MPASRLRRICFTRFSWSRRGCSFYVSASILVVISLYIILTFHWILILPFNLLYSYRSVSDTSHGSDFRSSPIVSLLKLTTITARSFHLQASRLKVYNCSNLLDAKASVPLLVRTSNSQWQNPYSTGIYLYSAFYDYRMTTVYRNGADVIRILAMIDVTSHQTHFFCQIWFGNASAPLVTNSEVSEIWVSEWDSDVRHQSYSPCILSCVIPSGATETERRSGLHVSVSDKPCRLSKTYLPVMHFGSERSSSPMSRANNFVACVKPLDFSEDHSSKLMEWIEINRILGVDLIHIYTFKVHPNVSKVLDYYEQLGVVKRTVYSLPGNQPNMPFERSVFGQRNLWQKRRNELIPYNHCFYEHLYSSKYVIPLDIDEIIVPKRHNTLSEMFAYLRSSPGEARILEQYASFAVKNVYFFESFSNSNPELAVPADVKNSTSYFLRHVYRSANFSQGSKSVKSFIRTDAAYSVFNHYALESLLPGIGRSTELSERLVQMNHYRSRCPPTMSVECKNNFLKYVERDTLLWKYKTNLTDRIEEAIAKMKGLFIN